MNTKLNIWRFRIANPLNVCPDLLLSCKIECKECDKEFKCLCEVNENESCNL